MGGGGALLAALLVLRFTGSDDAAGGGPRGGATNAVEVQFEIVNPVEIGGRVTAVGTILSNEEVQIRSQVSGQIEEIAFGEGARVSKGDLLVKINDDELQAQLLRGESRVAIAETQAERQKQLFEKNFISKEEYDNALNELRVVQAETQLTKAQIAKSEIRAPFAGTIGLRHVSEGSYVSPAAVITSLQDNSRMKVDFAVPEKYSRMIGDGDEVTFRVQTIGETYQAKVYSTDSRIDEATRTLRVRAIAANPGGRLIAGSFANVEVKFNPRTAITIPAFALVPVLRGHKVFLCRGGIVEERPVVIGERSDNRVEIAEGLFPGDTLITSAILQLRAGMPVVPGQTAAPETP